MLPDLRRMQRWMQACVMSPGDAGAAIASAGAALEVPPTLAPGLIRPSPTLQPLERLDIYRGMYHARLIEALRVDYPGLAHLLGGDQFDELARLYLRQHPSHSYTLNRLGDALPAFLGDVEGLRAAAFARDLARLELAETLVFDAAASPVVDSRAIADVPPERWAQLRLQPIAALRLLTLKYPAHVYLKADPSERRRPRARQTFLAVYRQGYAVRHLPLDLAGFLLLEKLIAGHPLGDALDAVSQGRRLPSPRIFAWFKSWFDAGLFQAVRY